MKVEELSIGDWVNVLNYHWDGSPLQAKINGIIKKHGTYYLQFKGGALYAEIDCCEPIPLTKEILEMNGIKYQFGLPWYQYGDLGSEGFEVHFAIHCQMQLRYVHELQHALRLLGIDKEIKLEDKK